MICEGGGTSRDLSSWILHFVFKECSLSISRPPDANRTSRELLLQCRSSPTFLATQVNTEFYMLICFVTHSDPFPQLHNRIHFPRCDLHPWGKRVAANKLGLQRELCTVRPPLLLQILLDMHFPSAHLFESQLAGLRCRGWPMPPQSRRTLDLEDPYHL